VKKVRVLSHRNLFLILLIIVVTVSSLQSAASISPDQSAQRTTTSVVRTTTIIRTTTVHTNTKFTFTLTGYTTSTTITQTALTGPTTTETTTLATYTTSIYPTPENVTVLFSGNSPYNYEVDVASIPVSKGSQPNGSTIIPLPNLFQGQNLLIYADSLCAYGNYNPITVELYVNGVVVARSSTYCGATAAQITYTV